MKTRVSALMVALALALGMGHALAATPVQRGCVGESVSTNAQAIPRYGQLISSVATNASGVGGPGVGTEVQAVQAGQVPDTVFPNTCNP